MQQQNAAGSNLEPSCLPRPLAVAAHNLDLVRRYRGPIVQLEVDVFDQERPDFVAEAVCIQVALYRVRFPFLGIRSRPRSQPSPNAGRTYLERKPRAHLLAQNLGDHAVEGGQDPHGELRLDAALVDQVVEGVCEGEPEAGS